MSSGEEQAEGNHPLWKGLLPLVILSTLSSLDTVVDIYGAICRPIALFIISLTGLIVSDQGTSFTVAHLNIPWTRDCAGMNTLLVLLAIYAWMNRNTEQNSRYWLKMLCVIPLAIISNVLRVLTLVGYRYLFFPEVESPQMHYFWGLFWLIPFALFTIPASTEPSKKSLCFELLHISAVVGLIAPLLNLSNHWITAVGVLFLLLNSKFKSDDEPYDAKILIIWITAALTISWSGIESLWLPWLLVCPLTINSKWLFSYSGFGCLATSSPLFVLIPYASICAGAIFFFTIMNWPKVKTPETTTQSPPKISKLRSLLSSSLALLLFLPFVASILFNSVSDNLQPPPTMNKKIIQGMGYQLQLNNQSPKLGLLWYDPQGSNRHHALEVCLQYRGIYLESTEVSSVKTDGERWFTEFFIVKNKLVSNHNDYIWQTLGFRKNPGIHIILVANKKDYSATNFEEEAQAIVNQLYKAINS
ncbi:archaeosortase/exosortase family protein [Lentisphaera marina]|uniref:exosortase Z n=1 Tax=Lentisphaera marina TaxID=1111041 RepID=UPI0023651210|nr:archaeosortase/exosortase family protein [Lentisphaera marina]MDD7987441.1 archaeosortase/exosortase family protein [Lentisphaera marina]